MKVVVRGPRRHLPTSVPYRTDPLSAFDVEAEVDGHVGELKGWLALNLPAIRKAQVDDLDAQEAAFCAKYRVTPPQPATPPAAPVGATAERALDAARATAALNNGEAPRVVVKAPEPAPGALTAATRDELRRLNMRFIELGGEPVPGVPATETEGQALVRQLADAITIASPPPADYPPADTIPLKDRWCRGDHGRERVILESRVYDYSVQHFGKPLCRDHQVRATRVR